jgi:aminocarboxymuconate-semialdehyde decarboxylase
MSDTALRTYDTILHSDGALRFLIGSVGADRVLLGSDYPFDMAYLDGARQLRSLGIPENQQTFILGDTARTLQGIV